LSEFLQARIGEDDKFAHQCGERGERFCHWL
jgi:hypothetical protein